jgi:transcriptional regulator with XRE-family HTH domain
VQQNYDALLQILRNISSNFGLNSSQKIHEMNNYGKAFKIIRLIKDIHLNNAAIDLKMDERTLRDIESGKTQIISDRFDQLLAYYAIRPEVVLELAADQNTVSNVIQEVKRDNIVHQNNGINDNERTAYQKMIDALQARIEHMEQQEVFYRETIQRLTQS